MASLYETFNMLSVREQIAHLQTYLGNKPNLQNSDISISGGIVAEFYESYLGKELNGARKLLEQMIIPGNYMYCLSCHNIYEENFKGYVIGKLDEPKGIPMEFVLFEISSGVCSEECVMSMIELNRAMKKNSRLYEH